MNRLFGKGRTHSRSPVILLWVAVISVILGGLLWAFSPQATAADVTHSITTSGVQAVVSSNHDLVVPATATAVRVGDMVLTSIRTSGLPSVLRTSGDQATSSVLYLTMTSSVLLMLIGVIGAIVLFERPYWTNRYTRRLLAKLRVGSSTVLRALGGSFDKRRSALLVSGDAARVSSSYGKVSGWHLNVRMLTSALQGILATIASMGYQLCTRFFSGTGKSIVAHSRISSVGSYIRQRIMAYGRVVLASRVLPGLVGTIAFLVIVAGAMFTGVTTVILGGVAIMVMAFLVTIGDFKIERLHLFQLDSGMGEGTDHDKQLFSARHYDPGQTGGTTDTGTMNSTTTRGQPDDFALNRHRVARPNLGLQLVT